MSTGHPTIFSRYPHPLVRVLPKSRAANIGFWGNSEGVLRFPKSVLSKNSYTPYVLPNSSYSPGLPVRPPRHSCCPDRNCTSDYPGPLHVIYTQKSPWCQGEYDRSGYKSQDIVVHDRPEWSIPPARPPLEATYSDRHPRIRSSFSRNSRASPLESPPSTNCCKLSVTDPNCRFNIASSGPEKVSPVKL